jgi:hypothetical protein
MAKKRFTVEQIIYHLREANVLLAQGESRQYERYGYGRNTVSSN